MESDFSFIWHIFQLWDSCKIGIPYHDRESNDAVILGFMVAIFIQKVPSSSSYNAVPIKAVSVSDNEHPSSDAVMSQQLTDIQILKDV